MPVVINEFEVVSEPPTEQGRRELEASPQAPAPPDVERILAVLRARSGRVRAY